MTGFNDVKLTWEDKEYVIPADRVLGAIARIEDTLTLDELGRFMAKDTVPRARLAMAFGSVLRYAGARVNDDAVYEGMFGGDKEVRLKATIDATTTLLGLMLPPSAYASAEEGAGEANPPKRKVRKS